MASFQQELMSPLCLHTPCPWLPFSYPLYFYTNTHLPVWSCNTMVRWFGLGQEPCWPAACCHKWAVISALGPGHWLQFTSAQQVRTAKVSIGFPMASARLPSKLNRNDRGTGKVQERTVVQINTLGEWSTDQIICETTSKGCCHITLHSGKVLSLQLGEKSSILLGKRY